MFVPPSKYQKFRFFRFFLRENGWEMQKNQLVSDMSCWHEPKALLAQVPLFVANVGGSKSPTPPQEFCKSCNHHQGLKKGKAKWEFGSLPTKVRLLIFGSRYPWTQSWIHACSVWGPVSGYQSSVWLTLSSGKCQARKLIWFMVHCVK